ncbi:S24 family peptidase [uncultured Akkermansia sp.]|jgi:SOS-response transcriptional repressor LexA|uniref:LexA family transcriptional regulator n=2 Tax=Akkermansia TaxID=239934 RepID=UPI00262EEFB8|nr:S24 family peptidase [uncultured Akkermansia sp.]
MTPTKEDIKKWLKASGMTREELAKKCGVNKRTVDLWLSSARDVPSKSLLVIQRLMQGEDDSLKKIHLPLSEEQWAVVCEAMKGQSFLEFVNTALQNAAKEKEGARKKFTPVEPLPATSFLDQPVPVIGNIAAGALTPGDNIPYHIKTERPVGKWEYVLQVEGKSMEPFIPDGSLVVMRKHTIPPIPKVGTIVEYNDERGVTLKKLGRKKNPETGKMEYVLHPLNPDFGDIEPMDGGKISGIYVETLERWKKA